MRFRLLCIVCFCSLFGGAGAVFAGEIAFGNCRDQIMQLVQEKYAFLDTSVHTTTIISGSMGVVEKEFLSLDRHSRIEEVDQTDPKRKKIIRLSKLLVVKQFYPDRGVVRIRIISFSKGAHPQFKKVLSDALKQKPTGLILDLRDNRGGLLDETAKITNMLLRLRVTIFTRKKRGVVARIYRSFLEDVTDGLPIVVWVNKHTVSAAEIVAAALQDHKRATIIGQKTYGKGTAQTRFTLCDGRYFWLTTGYWYRPNGNHVHGTGVTPDIFLNKNEKKRYKNIPQKIFDELERLSNLQGQPN